MVRVWIRPLAVGMVLVGLSTVANAADVSGPSGEPSQPLPAQNQAPPDQTLSRWAVGVTAGTLGVGGEFSALITPYFVGRLTATWFELNPSSLLSKLNENGYNFTLSQITAGGLVDWHPFQNGFRFVAGIEYADFRFKESVSSQSSYTINGTTYTSAQIGNLYTNVTVKDVAAPYLGVGWDSAFYCDYIRSGNTAMKCDQLTIGVDLGALYAGGVNVTQTTDKSVPGLANDLAAESSKLKNTFNDFYSFYPVIMATLKYRF